MLLSELFDQLTYGELSSLFMGGVDCTGIQSESYPQVVSYVNMGLLAIYTRFPVHLQEVVIKLKDEVQIYYLDRKYAQTNTAYEDKYGEATPLPENPDSGLIGYPPSQIYIPGETLLIPKADRYIDDSVYYPFEDNVITIEEIFNEDGQTLFMNDGGEYWSVQTPSYNSVQIPYPEKENSLIVTYKASHPTIKVEGLRPAEVQVNVPVALIEPLLYYIGSRAFAGLNADQNAEGNNYLAKYEASCRKIEELGLVVKDSNINSKFDAAGWV